MTDLRRISAIINDELSMDDADELFFMDFDPGLHFTFFGSSSKKKRTLVIEGNQFNERAMEQALAAISTCNPQTIVLVCDEVTGYDINMVSWLNRNTDKGVRYYLIHNTNERLILCKENSEN